MDLAQFWFQGADGPTPPFQLGNSLRFRGAQQLSRTATSAGNSRTWTTSVWVKYAVPNGEGVVWMAGPGIYEKLAFKPSNPHNLFLGSYTGSWVYRLITTQQFRDPSAWMHIVVVSDTNNATASERKRIYINGVQVSAFSTQTNPGSGLQSYWNSATTHRIGTDTNPFHFNGYMAEFHSVDGTALDPTTFGEFNADGVWVPKAVTGVTYGTNGFYLDFSDPDNIGADRSGNGNNFTPTGFELTDTTSTNYDWMADSPTDNFATINPIDPTDYTSSPSDVSEANLTAYNGSSGSLPYDAETIAIPAGTGRYYWEVTNRVTTSSQQGFFIGLSDAALPSKTASTGQGARFSINDARRIYKWDGTQTVSASSPISSNQVAQVAFDGGTGEVWFGIDNTWYDTATTTNGNPATGANPSADDLPTDVLFRVMGGTAATPGYASGFYFNAGQRPFQFAPPAGFEPLSTAELPDVTITNPSEHFQTLLAPGPVGATQYSLANTTTGATSLSDGWGNCQLVWPRTDTQYPPFDFVRALNDINYEGHNDWFLPSVYELEIAYFNLRPTTQNNTVVVGGDNPFAVPARSGSYSGQVPPQTTVAAFQQGGAQAFDSDRYATSTEVNTSVRYTQSFADVGNASGYRYSNVQKTTVSGRARAFRREPWTGSEPAIGAAYAGGFYAGAWSETQDSNATHAIIVADKAGGENGGILDIAQSVFPNGLWWIKDRANTNQHQLLDSVRGGNQMIQTPGTGRGNYVAPAGNSVAWCWATPGNEVTNNDGSRPSQCDANVDAGFSVITYQGGTLGATYGHGLQGEPDFIMARRFDANAGWMCYHSSLGKDSWIDLGSNIQAQNANNVWGVNAPTDAVFGVSNTTANRNSEGSVVAYCWRSVPGYSSFGSYVGTGTTDAAFCFTGFRPAFLMTKSTSTGDWQIRDNLRGGSYNPVYATLAPNHTRNENAASSIYDVDFLSNGFKIRGDMAALNGSGQTIIWAAWAEHPFGGGNVSPSPAR